VSRECQIPLSVSLVDAGGSDEVVGLGLVVRVALGASDGRRLVSIEDADVDVVQVQGREQVSVESDTRFL
jgi:hypothetical protein